ncbi:hypothetical protein EKG83_06705 [Saccharothrix syringae]|uniref:Tyr recombinase domain-containing protein n=1 Tax=Saccharothrix syringae TaxID=103733 RepID=A0A5Q0GSY1_SACSY|nr:hypothetical protein EKG83_06705 [Saccharothrix syringae]
MGGSGSVVGGRAADEIEKHLGAFVDAARKFAGAPDVHLHDLRRTGNTLAAETGATPRELVDRTGHSSTRAAPRPGGAGPDGRGGHRGRGRGPTGTRGARKSRENEKTAHKGRSASALPAEEAESG